MAHTILIVDDSLAMRKALSRLFKIAAGLEVCGEASNGLEAIRMVGDLKPDLIVLDLCMPGINGLETARRMQSLKNAPPIILYSMNAEEISAKLAFSCGVAAIVSKVEGITTLISKARETLKVA